MPFLEPSPNPIPTSNKEILFFSWAFFIYISDFTWLCFQLLEIPRNMMVTKALPFNPTFYRPSELHSLKPTSLLRFPNSRTVLFGVFGSKVRVSKTITELVKSSAFRSGDGQKKFKVFQHEAFVKGSTEFHPESMADELGATLNRLSKWVVAFMFGVVLLWRHDAASLWLAMGSVINVIICLRLKRILNQQRPVSTLKSDPGMPSSHAQSIFYIIGVCILSIIERYGTNGSTLMVAVLALACGSYVSWLRVSQQFHTTSQVVVGGAIGSIFSILWYWWWHAFLREAYMSFRWVRIIVAFGGLAYSLCLLSHVIRSCLTNRQ
ncbi:lipid phosphate phosphatase epsilon 1, chloroplastic [Manihot esculenta]|uniref:Phosphatidic acid phosphatase type 2/haloperoxidase domain-containing protein n=1 Tax=Manihot esculenta TaxID=3983 RepID=A0A2C9WLW6_MANES|nr:lipid phosphate phosphatase epsilon 1, chloroplastic [Manihot esculenta]OAY60778.1 hypothetical protein MANES_01G138300v8 [Manihot esculenta]